MKKMNNKRKSKVVDTFMKEEVEKCKKRSSEILADEKKIFGVKVRRKSVINFLIFLESLKTHHKFQIPAYATGRRRPKLTGGPQPSL